LDDRFLEFLVDPIGHLAPVVPATENRFQADPASFARLRDHRCAFPAYKTACAGRGSSTNSTRSPGMATGWIKAILVPIPPGLGDSSISRTPRPRRSATASSRSLTSSAT